MALIKPRQVETRPAVREDADFIFSLTERTMRDYVIATYGVWDPEWQREHFNQRFAPADIKILRLDERDIGVLWLEERGPTLFLRNLQVQPELQRRGIGTVAIQLFLAEARKRGLEPALQVLRANPARRLYERLGFSVTGETATHFVMGYLPADEQS